MARNRLSSSQLVALKAELIGDPEGLTYTDGSGGDPGDRTDQDLLNSKSTGRTDDTRDLVASHELASSVDVEEYLNLTGVKRNTFVMLITPDMVSMQTPSVVALISNIFTAGASPLTRTALLELTSQSISRAKELFGQRVGYWDVRIARNLP